MLSSLFFIWISLTPQEAQSIVDRVPDDWYSSTTRLFEYCIDVKFQHPICPPIYEDSKVQEFTDSFFSTPIGGLTSKSLFQATVLYQIKRPADFWMVSLKLDGAAPLLMDKRLWAEAQWLWAKILFDQQKYKESLKIFDQLVPQMRGRAIFHQQRAWAQFFNGQYDKALGSIVSAESPLLYKVPFFEKFFLRALIEKETCHRASAINTIAVGRSHLSSAQSPSASHPWTVLCERRSLGDTCSRLRSYYDVQFRSQIKRGLEDLDLLEVELRDENLRTQADAATSKIVWPTIGGENWEDELGYIVVPIKSKCS